MKLRAIYLDEDGRYVFEDGTPVPWQPIDLRKVLVGICVTFALVIVIPFIAGFSAYRHITNDSIRANEALIRRVSAERIARTRAINEFIYDQCVLGEVRDVVIVQHLKDAKKRARATLPPGQLLQNQLESLDDGINALEPPDEPDCQPPPAVKPKGTP